MLACLAALISASGGRAVMHTLGRDSVFVMSRKTLLFLFNCASDDLLLMFLVVFLVNLRTISVVELGPSFKCVFIGGAQASEIRWEVLMNEVNPLQNGQEVLESTAKNS